MEIHLICVGERMPDWVQCGVAEYSKRFPREWRFKVREFPAEKRGKTGQPALWKEREGDRILAALSPSDYVVALDVAGACWSTVDLSGVMRRWMSATRRVSLVVGGPDGLSDACLSRAAERWSLSPLTFPHPLVRVIVAEQLYRGWTLLHNHPYHRG